MLWKPYRLRKNWQFQNLIEKGHKVVNRNFVIYLSPINLSEVNNCLYGISVPKSLVKRAVDRNLYKRQIRNMLIFYLKNHQNSCYSSQNHSHYQMVIIVRHNYLENNFAINQSSLYRSLFYIYQKLNFKELL